MPVVALSEVEALANPALDVLVDAGAAADFGSREQASSQVSVALGLFSGEDVAQPDEDHIDLPQPLSVVKARIAKALELKRQGWTTKRIVDQGLA